VYMRFSRFAISVLLAAGVARAAAEAVIHGPTTGAVLGELDAALGHAAAVGLLDFFERGAEAHVHGLAPARAALAGQAPALGRLPRGAALDAIPACAHEHFTSTVCAAVNCASL